MVPAHRVNVYHKTMVQTPFAYETLCGRFEAAVGRLDAAAVRLLEEDAAPWPKVEAAMREMAGESGLMQFAVFDQGAVASLSGAQIRCRLYLVGNPAIAARIVRIDERGALYVPFRVAVYAAPGTDDRDNRLRPALVVIGWSEPARAQ